MDHNPQTYLLVISGPHLGHLFKLAEAENTLGRSSDSDLMVADAGVLDAHLCIICEDGFCFAEPVDPQAPAFLNNLRLTQRRQVRDGDKITVGSTTLLKFTYQDHLDNAFEQEIFDAALRDGLTRAYTSAFLRNQLSQELSYANRHKAPLSLLLLEIDAYDAFVHREGHLAADALLVKLSTLLMGSIRAEDFFARVEDSRFAILGRGTDTKGSQLLAERLQEAVQRAAFDMDGQPVRITISVGIANTEHRTAEAPQSFFDLAENALDVARTHGPHAVHLASSD